MPARYSSVSAPRTPPPSSARIRFGPAPNRCSSRERFVTTSLSTKQGHRAAGTQQSEAAIAWILLAGPAQSCHDRGQAQTGRRADAV